MSKKTIKENFFKAKETAVKFFKSTAKALRIPLRIALVLAFVVIPFLHNKISNEVAKCIWYPTCALYIISDIANIFIKRKTPTKHPRFDYWGYLGTFSIIIIFSSAFLINYYDTSYNWWWTIFVLIAIDIPIFILGLHNYLKKEKKHTEVQQQTSRKTCWKYICFYWLIDLFYMTIVNYWTTDVQIRFVWLVLQFIFGGFAMVYIFYNLARLFLANTIKQWWGLLQDFLWGTAITVYLVFIIPNESLQNIVLAITAAIYGGLLTLVGVAWTIKDNSEKLKQERKLSIKPYLDVHHKCLADITELSTKDILTIEIGEIIVTQPTVSNEINDLFILRSRAYGHTERLDVASYSLKLNRFLLSNLLLYTEIENCGAGNAIDVKIRYNENEIASFCISTATPKYVLLVLKDELFGDTTKSHVKMNFSFEYTDVSSLGIYKQAESFEFVRNNNGELSIVQMREDFLTAPMEIL